MIHSHNAVEQTWTDLWKLYDQKKLMARCKFCLQRANIICYISFRMIVP